jgi:hypothetical protein
MSLMRLAPPEWHARSPSGAALEFNQEHVASVSATEGVYGLLDTDKKVLRMRAQPTCVRLSRSS